MVLVTFVETLVNVTLSVERRSVMIALAIPPLLASSVPLIVKFWLVDAEDGALMVSVVGIGGGVVTLTLTTLLVALV